MIDIQELRNIILTANNFDTKLFEHLDENGYKAIMCFVNKRGYLEVFTSKDRSKELAWRNVNKQLEGFIRKEKLNGYGI